MGFFQSYIIKNEWDIENECFFQRYISINSLDKQQSSVITPSQQVTVNDLYEDLYQR